MTRLHWARHFPYFAGHRGIGSPRLQRGQEGGQSAVGPVAFIRAMTAMGLDPMIVRLP